MWVTAWKNPAMTPPNLWMLKREWIWKALKIQMSWKFHIDFLIKNTAKLKNKYYKMKEHTISFPLTINYFPLPSKSISSQKYPPPSMPSPLNGVKYPISICNRSKAQRQRNVQKCCSLEFTLLSFLSPLKLTGLSTRPGAES